MNNVTHALQRAGDVGLRLIVQMSGWICGVVFLVSFIGSREPNVPDFPMFAQTFGVWFYSVMVFCVALVALRERIYFVTIPFGTMLMVNLMMVPRLGNSLHLFPEVWVALASLGVVFLTQFIMYRQPNASRERQLQGSVSQQDAPADVAIRYAAVPARHSFANVVGMQDVKARLLAAGKEVVASQRKGDQARNGVLMTGKPGNGKTFIAEALAGELNLPFLSVAYGDVASKWINQTTENVVKVFADAKRQAPCLLFIDEIDSLIANRDQASSSDEAAKTTNALLTELVNIRRAGVLVVAASNFVDRLDPAAVREGRFDFKIEITPPDSVARRHMIRSKAAVAISEETIETAVRRWEGFSVARITAVMEEASRAAAHAHIITFDTLREALRRVQGRKGTIPEDTPTIAQLTMSADSKRHLSALANRMDRIMEIEAMGGSVPRGVLFYGPPGTGKTLTARALAKTANWAFLSVSGMDLIADPKKIDALVDEASELRPCLVFIDEADDVFRNRRHSNTATVTNKLLAALDGAGGKVPDILFVAATNHPDEMDPAALRGGRFTEKIEFDVPDAATLVEYITKWKSTTKAMLAPTFCIEQAAEQLEGNSMANVREILQMAVNHAISRLDTDAEVAVVDMHDIEAAVVAVNGDMASAY